jgi:hypothetical protein
MEQMELFDDKQNRRFGVFIDYDTADRITVANLQSYGNSLIEQLKDHFEKGAWLHPEDVPAMEKTIEAIRIVLKDYGETL